MNTWDLLGTIDATGDILYQLVTRPEGQITLDIKHSWYQFLCLVNWQKSQTFQIWRQQHAPTPGCEHGCQPGWLGGCFISQDWKVLWPGNSVNDCDGIIHSYVIFQLILTSGCLSLVLPHSFSSLWFLTVAALGLFVSESPQVFLLTSRMKLSTG